MYAQASQVTIPVMQSKFLSAVVDRSCELGADRGIVLEGCLLRSEVLSGPTQPIPSACVYRASTRAARLSKNPYLCAEIASQFEWSDGFVPPETMSDTPSLGDLLVAWLHFVEAAQISMNYTMAIKDGRAILIGRRILQASQPPGQADAWDIVAWLEMLRARLGPVWNSALVEVLVFDPKAIPPTFIPKNQVKKCDAWGLSMSFPASWLMQQSKFERNEATETDSPIQKALDLADLFSVIDYSAWPGLDGFAKFIGLHPKTLQRELARHGTTGANLVDRAKMRQAKQWLTEGRLSITDIGKNLGYKNPSAFTRTCRRWFGSSPYRLRHDLDVR
ncbi:AraC family transcriptional regulator [Ruegeria sp. HKCCA5491]|uniref:helix-turn-helix transcriptional regulator n=1 Tax=Ruegeria sp. HKCCA5491 TaxID=2682986 RepID=UPI001488FBBF|nr:AraC family transcriptional regulator [Ruegeria sp. HKCCA5491]